LYQLDIFSDYDIVGAEWTNAEFLSCANCVNPVATITETTTFYIQITYANGCTEDLVLYIPIDNREDVFIPSIFSPNGDGTNDVFYVQTETDRNISEFIIYDRWGNRVAYRANVLTNDPSFGWRGDWNGELLNPGVYVYYIVLENGFGEEQIFSGDISILR